MSRTSSIIVRSSGWRLMTCIQRDEVRTTRLPQGSVVSHGSTAGDRRAATAVREAFARRLVQRRREVATPRASGASDSAAGGAGGGRVRAAFARLLAREPVLD